MTDLPASNVYVGTSSWSTTDWYDVFYPPELKSSEFISYYSQHYRTVEVDATFYRQPSLRMVDRWAERTPRSFTFAAKVPQLITHEKYLLNCQPELTLFLTTMSRLGDKLGPLLFQFPYLAKKKDEHEYKTGDDFCQRLAGFLPTLPRSDFRFAIEVRNAHWLKPALLELLRNHNVALTLSCYFTMPSLGRIMRELDVVTSDFSYVRFLGHHRRMDSLIDKLMKEEGKEKKWNQVVVDKSDEMARWTGSIRELADRDIDIFVYFNNHYAGFAPGSIEQFIRIWREQQEAPS